MDNAMTLGEYVKRGRLAKKIGKAEAAKRVGISAQYWANIEKGSVPSEEVLMKIVDVLELDEFHTFKLADRLPPHVLAEAKRLYFSRR